jgi:hypothetical protein
MKRELVLALALCLLLALSVPALAQVSAGYNLSWHVIGGGGGQSSSAGHTLMATVGQPLTGAMLSGGHSLCSGFWCGRTARYRVYLPLVLRNH